jgi:ABC-2 type transport system ATP-binding protein
MEILKTINLTKKYKDKFAINQVNLTVEKGDIFGLIGQNGAGKTTFMRIIMGLTVPDSGEVHLFGEHSKQKIAFMRSRTGSVIETPALFENMTGEQNLEYFRIQQGVSDKKRVQECLNIVDLLPSETGRKKVKHYSLGMKQRLGLALSILKNPDFLVLDEPTNGLDPTGIIKMRDLISRLSTEGITLLVSSHILSELAQIANKYAIIHQGRLIKSLTRNELHNECKAALTITVDNASKAVYILETKMGIHDYKQISDHIVRIYDLNNDPAKIAANLIQAGVQLSALYEVGDTLETYYINVIRGAET